MKHVLLSRSLLFCTFLFLTITVVAQDPETLRAQFSTKLKADSRVSAFAFNKTLGTPSVIDFKPAASVPAAQSESLVRNLFNLNGANFYLKEVSTDKPYPGITVTRYQLYFKGIKVEFGAYAVTSANGNIQYVSAEAYILDNNFSVTPVLTEAQSRQYSLSFINARRYAWEDIDEMRAIATNPNAIEVLNKNRAELDPAGELVIARDYSTNQPRLAYKHNIYATEPLSRDYVYVDAENGTILLKDAIIKHAGKLQTAPAKRYTDEPGVRAWLTAPALPEFTPIAPPPPSVLGSAETRYAGTRGIYAKQMVVPLLGAPDPNNPLSLLQYSGQDPRTPVSNATVYVLTDDTRGNGISTYDLNGVGGVPVSIPSFYLQGLAFVDDDNVWKNETPPSFFDHKRGATSNGSIGTDEATNDDFATDAHWGAEMVYDYWKARHNRLSYDGKNATINSFIHYGPAYDNAFWNGSAMTYGDGSGTSLFPPGFRPLMSLDVCGHEIGHGVCSFTSNLVYASESGAMNEGLSDIWAACVERYVETLTGLNFEEFQVGEQIAPDNVGLRRMDNPKAYTNPDTRGGQYWTNVIGCAPTLANDQCGVHNNSGVLNKWFYLLVRGPVNSPTNPVGTGLPAYVDDGMADNGTALPHDDGNIYDYNTILAETGYQFLGIDYLKAEKITFLMELGLTPNASFDEARTVSIAAARALYGACSQEEISTTNAWYSVGVGARFTVCTAPLLEVLTAITAVPEIAPGTCPRYLEYDLQANLTTAQGSAVTINFSVTGGTATAGKDFDLMSPSITYNPGETGLRTVKLRVYDDGFVEGSNETISIRALSVTPVYDQTFNFSIIENDITPIIGGLQTKVDENFTSTAVGTVPAGWSVIKNISPGPVDWNVRNSSVAGLVFTGNNKAIIELTLAPGQALYDGTADANLILKTPMIDGTGLSNFTITMVYQAGGEGSASCTPACDYGRLEYSYDGTNFFTFNNPPPVMVESPTPTDFSFSNPPELVGRQFYLGIRWINDALVVIQPGSIAIDDFKVTAMARAIETSLGDNGSEPIYVDGSNPAYFYASDGQLIAKIENNSADLGCVNASIHKEGNGFVSYPLINGQRSLKAFELVPTSNPSATHTVTFYFTDAELSSPPIALGALRIIKTTASDIDLATTGNSVFVTPTYQAFPAAGYHTYSATFSGFGKFALVTPGTLPVSCVDFKATKGNNNVNLQWKVAQETNVVRYEVERNSDGSNYATIGTVAAGPQNNGLYHFTDNGTGGTRVATYRLKQVDADGRMSYICSELLVKYDGSSFDLGSIHPNPGSGLESFVNVFTEKAMKLQIEYMNNVGQVISRQDESLQPGSSRLKLHMKLSAAGVYLVRFSDEDGTLLGSQVFIKQ